MPATRINPQATEKPLEKPDESGPRVKVRSVRVIGAKLIPAAELQAQLDTLLGQELSLGQLQAAALRLIGYYAERGYLARVFLPPQAVKDGVIEYQVVEGTRGKLSLVNKGERIDIGRVRAFLEARLAPGAPMNLAALGESLNILNEQPGAIVQAALAPGVGETVVDLTVTASDGPLLAFGASANNHGSRGAGEYQVSGLVTLSNPTGRFDAASLLLNVAEGSRYLRGDYSLALGDRGLRAGANASYLDYRLIQPSFRALSARGTASTVGLTLTYPVRRLATRQMSVTGSLDQRRLDDSTAAGDTSRRVVTTGTVGLNGFTALDGVVLGDLLSYGIGVTAGDSDQRNAAALAADQAGRRTQGSFAKLRYSLTLLKALDSQWTLSAGLNGQLADKNLESTERIALGGVAGVRAYPAGEASGDEGWILNLNLVRRLGDGWTVGAFVDSGEIAINHTVPAGDTARNRYTLSGAGLSIEWQPSRLATLGLLLAAPLGKNPARDANDNNVDGRKNQPRLWANVSVQF